MKKILIEENAELANKHIQQVENEYINRLSILCNAIECLGIGKASKGFIIDAITNNSATIEAEYSKANNIESQESKLGSLLEAEAGKRMQYVRDCAKEFATNYLFNGLRLDNPTLFDWFEVSKDGVVSLSESVKESISENVKVYTSSEVGAKMYTLQQSLAKDLQTMYNLMADVDNSEKVKLGFDAHRVLSYSFPRGLFNFKEEPETGRLTITPESINFDPEERIDDSFDVDEIENSED